MKKLKHQLFCQLLGIIGQLPIISNWLINFRLISSSLQYNKYYTALMKHNHFQDFFSNELGAQIKPEVRDDHLLVNYHNFLLISVNNILDSCNYMLNP